jgi:hypothetical protein
MYVLHARMLWDPILLLLIFTNLVKIIQNLKFKTLLINVSTLYELIIC